MFTHFTKSQLMTGDIVVSRYGWKGIILKGTNQGDIVKWFTNGNGEIINSYRSLSTINEDLTYHSVDKFTEIVKVYRCTEPEFLSSIKAIQSKYLVYDGGKKKMTIAQIEDALGFRVEIVSE